MNRDEIRRHESVDHIHPTDAGLMDPTGEDAPGTGIFGDETIVQDRDWKSTRLNSSHANISYAVFCLKKKKISIICLPRSSANFSLVSLLRHFYTSNTHCCLSTTY